MRPRKVCVCRSVDKKTLEEAVKNGARTLGQLTLQTGAARNCGTCLPQVIEILHDTLEQVEAAESGQEPLTFKKVENVIE